MVIKRQTHTWGSVWHEGFWLWGLSTPPVPRISILLPGAAGHSPWLHTGTDCRELTLTGNSSWCQAIIAVRSLVLPLQYRATGAPLAVCTNSHPGCTPHSPILPLPPSLWFLRLHQTESPSALDRGVDIWLRYTRRNKHYWYILNILKPIALTQSTKREIYFRGKSPRKFWKAKT